MSIQELELRREQVSAALRDATKATLRARIFGRGDNQEAEIRRLRATLAVLDEEISQHPIREELEAELQAELSAEEARLQKEGAALKKEILADAAAIADLIRKMEPTLDRLESAGKRLDRDFAESTMSGAVLLKGPFKNGPWRGVARYFGMNRSRRTVREHLHAWRGLVNECLR